MVGTCNILPGEVVEADIIVTFKKHMTHEQAGNGRIKTMCRRIGLV